MITLLIMSNGRYEYLARTLASLDKLHGSFSRIVMNDDSIEKRGFTGAMIRAWDKLKKDDNEWVFHLEEDWLILEDIWLDDMIEVMQKNSHLLQIVLSRESPSKRRRLERFVEKTDGRNFWTEHKINFSCNPCLYRKSLIYESPWPKEENSEKYYARLARRKPTDAFAYWGKMDDAPKVKHIGIERTGYGY